MLDTAAGAWLDRNGLVTSSKTSKGHAEYDPSFELMRRCRHASASVGVRIYVYGGLKGGKVFFSFFFSLGGLLVSLCSSSPPLPSYLQFLCEQVLITGHLVQVTSITLIKP